MICRRTTLINKFYIIDDQVDNSVLSIDWLHMKMIFWFVTTKNARIHTHIVRFAGVRYAHKQTQ